MYVYLLSIGKILSVYHVSTFAMFHFQRYIYEDLLKSSSPVLARKQAIKINPLMGCRCGKKSLHH